ncbi:MAG: bifunctional methylenetetrahydrofolate dehydrogenase/methenyltetrahydrofolate cyclohydrolase [Rickettsiales bacterium]|jgi:methylenetetrahydrofolate dehydrogenase (NADP+)/methenyltetrahydrofolate cyclohydrolase|nr:bifunctional methylenetetrahydrofolate dehydrogenase/methenyltetrahydrofolate cyclohydrolase [Rickettsiales bacterium]
MQLINGQEVAKNIKLSIWKEVDKLETKPCLAVIIVGENSASRIYVKGKEKACTECGFRSLKYELEESTSEEYLLQLIAKLNDDREVSGILVQLPLPRHISEEKIILAIKPEKDVDCFNPFNVGMLYSSKSNSSLNVLPCTANGCLKLIKTVCNDLSGKSAIVIGRSNIVGKPMAQLLLNENCTITIAHSKTKNLTDITKTADIIVVAIGKAKFLKEDMVKDGAIVIDVGINRLEDGTICGDVDFENVSGKCSYITPVPKGVGPMTIACLMENTYNFFINSQGSK